MQKTKLSRKGNLKKFPAVGSHIIADFWGIKTIDDQKQVEGILQEAARKANSTLLRTSSYKFQPQGVTAVVLLSESHISIHTWPERQYASIDAYTCGKHTDPKKAIQYLREIFKPKKVNIIKVLRGKGP